jgi:clan AA aspartic protease
MITGVVNINCEATLRLTLNGTDGQQEEIEVVIDTGFSGFLALPPALITSLGLPWRGREQAVLGDGSLHLHDVYSGTVIWDGIRRVVEIDAVDTDPLIGMGLLYGYDVRIQAIEGGAVTIEALSANP